MCMVQGGDIINNNGTNGESAYNEYFKDENFSIKHDEEGILGMVNMGPNTNQSQFYITTQPCYHLDGTNVAFGKVVKGLNIIVEMSDFPRENDIPLTDLVIADCGEFQPGESWNISENDGTEDTYPPWPDDWDENIDNINIEKIVQNIKNSGNYYYNRNDFSNAGRKYTKCLRYIDWYGKSSNTVCNKTLRNTVMINLASAQLKKHKYKEAGELCSKILLEEKNNGKVYYKRAQAMLNLKEYDRALNDLKTALMLHPNDKNIIQTLNLAKKYKLNYLKKERLFFSKLFN